MFAETPEAELEALADALRLDVQEQGWNVEGIDYCAIFNEDQDANQVGICSHHRSSSWAAA